MFIKIKLEPQNLKALSALKNISYFSINDDATINDLKMKIEEYVDVPAEHQELRTLTKVFQNNWNVKDVCNVRGSAIMLYAYDEYYEYGDPQFVCFLQVYTNELAVQQQELEQRSKVATPSSSTSSVTLIADSDTESDSEGTDSETDSCKLSNSDSDGSSTDSSCAKKRSKHERKNIIVQNKKLKVTAPTSETLCQYLDEFPKDCPLKESSNESLNKEPFSADKFPKSSTKEIAPIVNHTLKPTSIDSLNKQTVSTVEAKKTNLENKDKLQDNNAFLETNPINNSLSNSSNLNQKIQSNIITTTNNNKALNNNIHPCYSINPEIRDYLAIIACSDTTTTISGLECEELLVWFFDRFRACDSSSELQFDNKTAISLFEGKLWIACMNSATFQWISTNITKYSVKSYKILALKDTKHLCEVVVPLVSNSKNVLDIFDLLEKQNRNITTFKWSLQSRRVLLATDKDFNEKSISTFCTNEMFLIFMDTQSKECLEKLDFKLKYCFWQIVLKFR